MRHLGDMTGGAMVLSDSFSYGYFQQSVQRLLSQSTITGHLNMAFNADMEVIVSKELKICGLIGPAISNQKKGPHVSDTEIGLGGTSSWKFASLTPRSTAAVFFEVANQVF